jgi:hypothetical protein
MAATLQLRPSSYPHSAFRKLSTSCDVGVVAVKFFGFTGGKVLTSAAGAEGTTPACGAGAAGVVARSACAVAGESTGAACACRDTPVTAHATNTIPIKIFFTIVFTLWIFFTSWTSFMICKQSLPHS